jgi:hypothetical protein
MAKATAKQPYHAVYHSPYGEVLTFNGRQGDTLYFKKEAGGVTIEGGAMTTEQLDQLVKFNRLTKQ